MGSKTKGYSQLMLGRCWVSRNDSRPRPDEPTKFLAASLHKLAASREKLAVSREKLAVSREKLAVSREKLAVS